jgi:hypothetical protein
MQQVDLTQFPNKSGWRVVHNSDLMTYQLKAENGSVKPGTYTHRTFAEKALHDYLVKMKDTAPKALAQKKNKVNKPDVNP